jgi:hypothetical protein
VTRRDVFWAVLVALLTFGAGFLLARLGCAPYPPKAEDSPPARPHK